MNLIKARDIIINYEHHMGHSGYKKKEDDYDVDDILDEIDKKD